MNLGTALAALDERESGTTRLEEAVIAFRASLEERTRARVPLKWAVAQSNLGSALGMLGERESGTARLEESVTAYRAALEELTRERVPLDWANAMGNQSQALMLLAERRRDVSMTKQALDQIEAAVAVARQGGDQPTAAGLERLLPKARDLVSRLGG